MDVMEKIFAQAAEAPRRVAFPEATEEKILLACRECVDRGLIVPVLVGGPDSIREAAGNFHIDLTGMELYDAGDEAALEELVAAYHGTNGMLSEKTLKRRAQRDSMYTALYLLALDRVDAVFAGLSHTTGDVVAAGSLVIGLKEGIVTPSSVGIFKIPGYQGSEGELLCFGDSAVCVDPGPEELASIAISACETVKELLGWQPRCAMLSYSTDGSAESAMVDKVRAALKIAREKHPDLLIDGEFQLDAAIDPQVAAKKVRRESGIAGKANIIIWPDLNVGNISVKLVQNFARADAYGPLLQGFRKVVCDCSRSAPVSELVGNIAMAAVRCQNKEEA